MRRRPVRRTWLTVGLLVAGAAVVAGCTSDPAPGAVTVSWADKTHRAVRVTWTESGAFPNKIAVEGVVAPSPNTLMYTRAEDPNTVLIPTSGFPLDGNYRIAVSVGTTSGGSTGPAGRSPTFDTDGPVRPSLTSAKTQGGSAVLVKWRPGPRREDFSPGDPLDVPATTVAFTPTVIGAGAEKFRVLGPVGRSTQHLIKGMRPPYRFQVRSTNEWGTTWGAHLVADTTSVTARVPTRSVFGAPVVVRGRVVRQRLVCTGGRCASRPEPAPGLPVVLQARDNPAIPWAAAGVTRTRAGGTFYFAPPGPGTRQYRVVAQTHVGGPQVAYGSVTGVTTSVNRARALSARFNVPVARYGQRVTVTLRMAPAANIRSTLQRWNGRTWIGVAYVPVRGGVATYSFATRLRGSYAYRFVVPTTVYDGRAVDGVSTGSIILTTR